MTNIKKIKMCLSHARQRFFNTQVMLLSLALYMGSGLLKYKKYIWTKPGKQAAEVLFTKACRNSCGSVQRQIPLKSKEVSPSSELKGQPETWTYLYKGTTFSPREQNYIFLCEEKSN